MLKAALVLLCSEGGGRARTLIAALEHLGVAVVRRPDAGLTPWTPTICLLDELDSAAAVESTRELSAGGLHRLVLVWVSDAPLAAAVSWQLLRAGAGDVLTWCDSAPPARQIAARLDRWIAVEKLVRSPLVEEQLVGVSRAWIATLRQVVETAAFTNGSVLLLGESGTGKELLARLIHTLDRRPDKRDLIVLDCTTVIPELAGSEFFGHERGAFTGASCSREGAFALADRGTLFLDEVGELPLPMQAQLLRAVQERSFKRLGGNNWSRVELRLVCATNRDLTSEVDQGGFRSDFYHRIASQVIRVPPLRERIDDLLPLATFFFGQLRPGTPIPTFDPIMAEYLRRRRYLGNIRELRQLISRISDRHVGDCIVTPGDLPPEDLLAMEGPADWRDEAFEQIIARAIALGGGLREIGRAATSTAIRIALASEGGNVQRAAQRLGVTDRALQMRRAQGAG
jgi:transcriptional regulator with GAF, ATPase, and Fis domain